MVDLRPPVAVQGLELELLRAVHKLLQAGWKLLDELLRADPAGRLAAML